MGDRRWGARPGALPTGWLLQTTELVAGDIEFEKKIEFLNYVALSATRKRCVRELGILVITSSLTSVTD